MTAPQQRLNPLIREHVEAVEEAIKLLQEKTDHARSYCNHFRVAHAEYRPEFCPRRICLSCGFEEVGAFWATDTNWHLAREEPVLGNSPHRDVMRCSMDTLYSYRVPYVKHAPNGE